MRTATPLRVLLVEDDEGDAVLVRELLADAAEPVSLIRARSLREAEELCTGDVDCVLLDLALPDSSGLEALTRLRHRGADAVVVLTGGSDRAQGMAAVAAGAQDFLLKGQIDGLTLERALRYAVHRNQADQIGRELEQAQLLAAESLRLSRGLLPEPVLRDPAVGYAARSIPGGSRLLLGGDFHDVVQTDDDALWVLIGDICGHGPDEAALGVALRIAWRTLVLGGHPADAILPTMQQLLVHERHRPYLFVTVVMLCIAADRATAALWSAGHPAPLLRTGGAPWTEPRIEPDLPLGVVGHHTWKPIELPLGTGWELLLYTDGLIEGRSGPDTDVLWVDGLLALLNTERTDPDIEPALVVEELTARVRRLAPDHNDDMAVVMLTHRP